MLFKQFGKKKGIIFIIVCIMSLFFSFLIDETAQNFTISYNEINYKMPLVEADSLILSNDELTVIMDGANLDSPTGAIFSQVTSLSHDVELEPERSDEITDFCAGTGGLDGFEYYVATDMTVIDSIDYYNSTAYRIITPRSTSSYSAQWNTTIILPNDRNYFLVHVEIENTDSKTIIVDQVGSHVHDGVQALSHIRAKLGSGVFPDSTSDDQFFVYGEGIVSYSSTTYWQSHTPSSTKPFYTIYDGVTGDAVTVGFLQGTTNANQIIFMYRNSVSDPIEARVASMAGEASIPVGETYSYDLFVAIHDNDVETGENLYDEVENEYSSFLQPQELEDQILFEENFNSDDIWSDPNWYRSTTSYYVDEANGWLHKDTTGSYDQYVRYSMDLTFPFTVEFRGRLVSGGRDYTIPILELIVSNSTSYRVSYNEAGNWWRFRTYQFDTSNGPQSENTWWNFKIEMSNGSQFLYGKSDSAENWDFIGEANFVFDNPIVSFGFMSPWDSVIEVDYVKVSSNVSEPPVNTAPILSNSDISPSNGDTSTTFTFTVTYTDAEGDIPSYMNIDIDGTAYDMTLSSGSVSTGATYLYSTTLSEGTHNYYFTTSDGEYSDQLPSSGSYNMYVDSEPPIASTSFAIPISYRYGLLGALLTIGVIFIHKRKKTRYFS